MKIHFIAIGGSIMHSLAIALRSMGHEVSGSDDQIFEPARSKLTEAELLPPSDGWHPDRISADMDAIILGMHAFEDNPELLRAKELGVKLYSFPEFIYQHSRQKQRIVIAGSFGKTSITSMVMHVLEKAGKSFDYLVGGQVPGFENAVRLSEDAPIMLMEGDEYLSSRLDPRPKFLLYHPHMVVISGISWDHINVFPTEEVYVEQFRLLIQSLDKAGSLIYNEEDSRLSKLVKELAKPDIHYLYPYKTPRYRLRDQRFHLKFSGSYQPVSVYGRHNMSNLAAAWRVCELLSVKEEEFLQHAADFLGTKIRLETLVETEQTTLIRDYAHAPAKVRASVDAVRERYPKHHLVSCLELHTFSSLNQDFLPHYRKTLAKSDHNILMVDPEALKKRRMPPISKADLVKAFGDPNLELVENAAELSAALAAQSNRPAALLMMSSGNFGGLDLEEIGK